MKYIFKIIWCLAMKPIIVFALSLLYYSMIAAIFCAEFIWSLDLRRAKRAFELKWCAQEELNRDEDKYWYYQTPFDHFYGRKKWATKDVVHLF